MWLSMATCTFEFCGVVEWMVDDVVVSGNMYIWSSRVEDVVVKDIYAQGQ